MKQVIVVLGSLNSSTGVLSATALNRLNVCLDLFDSRKHVILCTGGWGANFNIAPLAHAQYTKEYLQSKGIEENYFLQNAIAAYTVEDAVKVKEILSSVYKNIMVITSQFHMERAQLIFNEICKDFMIKYSPANDPADEIFLESKKKHEKEAIRQIKTNGLYY